MPMIHGNDAAISPTPTCKIINPKSQLAEQNVSTQVENLELFHDSSDGVACRWYKARDWYW